MPDVTQSFTDYLFENQSDEVWELFCSELIYSDQNGELKDSLESCDHHDCGNHDEKPVYVIS